jgi:hypothetical protein
MIVGTRHTNEIKPLMIRLHLTPYFSKVTLVTFDNISPPRPEPAAPIPYSSNERLERAKVTHNCERQLPIEPLSEKWLDWDKALDSQG